MAMQLLLRDPKGLFSPFDWRLGCGSQRESRKRASAL